MRTIEYPTRFEKILRTIESYLKSNDYQSALRTIENRLNEADDCVKTAWLHYYKGMSLFWLGDYAEAGQAFETVRQCNIPASEKYLRGYAYYMLGYIAFQRSLFDIATLYFNRSHKIFDSAAKEREIANTKKMMGIIAYRVGRYSDARENLEDSLQYYLKNDHHEGIIQTGIALARIHRYLGNIEEAMKLLRGSLGEARKRRYPRETALCYEFLGELELIRENTASSIDNLIRALKISDEIAPEGDLAVEILRRLGDACTSAGKFEEARGYLERALALCDTLKDRYELGAVLRAFGNLENASDDRALARSYFEEAKATLRMIKESFELAGTCQVYAECIFSWLVSGSISDEMRHELLEIATSNVNEAIHLYIDLGLEAKAEDSRESLERLSCLVEPVSYSSGGHILRFEGDWLVRESMVARSRSMKKIVDRIETLARGEQPVLITGETGTGKELAAEMIHALSGRADGPFVAVNCAAVADSIFESEFNGHRRGAFTGASSDRTGFFEAASGGTLFLDEISELTNRQQAKLLRIIETGRFYRVGETVERSVDVRIVSATNVHPDILLESDRLRKDFYFRVCPQVVSLPPLRDRLQDLIPLLAWFMDSGGKVFEIEDEALELLYDYHWPGNVRELRNLAKGLNLLRGSGGSIRSCDLPERIRSSRLAETGRCGNRGMLRRLSPGQILERGNLEEVEDLLRRMLRDSGGNKSAVARRLGISRSTLYRKLAEISLS